MQTLKLRYSVVDEKMRNLVVSHLRQYSSCLHFAFNRIKDGFGEKDYTKLTENLQNIPLMTRWAIHCAFKEATQLISSNDKVIFGGKKNFLDRCRGRISKEEFKTRRLSPFYCIGDKEHHGNRNFRIQKDLDSILFQPSRDIRFDLKLEYGERRNLKKVLKKIFDLQVGCKAPVTFKLGLEHVYISFDEKDVFGVHRTRQVRDRIMAIDMNPNYVGWSVVDWRGENEYRIIKSGVYSFKKLNNVEWDLKRLKLPSTDRKRKYAANKLRHETFEVAKNLVDKARYFQCETFSVESLDMKSGNSGMGTYQNKIRNNRWLRKKLVENIRKRCATRGIHFQEVVAAYSSFIGNILFRKSGSPDMVNASIEIGRRGYEFKRQFTDRKISRLGNTVFPRMAKFVDTVSESLEEFGSEEKFESWKEMYSSFKNSGMMYRVPLQGDERWFQLKNKKSNVGFTETGLCSLCS